MQFDIILCTLVAHHFSNKQLSELFKNLKNQATLGVVINDLERNPLAFYSIRFLTSVFSKSAMVKFDAPLSVLRGFKKTELQSILQKAEIDTYNLSWQWAFRWKLVF
jgi:2-polyprenyl-3-methyl-5-hydroxy-6-metoxy-1,4-benzoquinol methylase